MAASIATAFADELCDRIVFDTSAFWACNKLTLEGLRSKRFRLSISLLALEEAWARAVREQWEERFFRQVRLLDPYIDLRMPVVPAMGHLMDLIGAVFRDGPLERSGAHAADMARKTWRILAEGLVKDRLLTDGAARSTAEVRRYADASVGALKETAARFASLGFEHTREVALHIASVQDGAARTAEGSYERLNAFCHIEAHQRAEAARFGGDYLASKKRDHDAIDAALLMHVAQPAFIATQDYRLIVKVDRTDTFQAPWIRSLGELCTRELPRGLPWGPSAREAATALNARTREELVELDARVFGFPESAIAT